MSYGIHLYHYPVGVDVINNTVYDNGASGIIVSHTASEGTPYNNICCNITVANNILLSNNRAGIAAWSSGDNIKLINNLFFGNGSNIEDGYLNSGDGVFTETGSITADPKVVNAVTHDFHLQSTSPAINAGINASIYGVTNDYDGVLRPQGSAFDIAAHEYTGTVFPTPTPTPTPTPAPIVSTKFSLNDRVQVNSGSLNVRSCASISCGTTGVAQSLDRKRTRLNS